jgi:hypothetical protein
LYLNIKYPSGIQGRQKYQKLPGASDPAALGLPDVLLKNGLIAGKAI